MFADATLTNDEATEVRLNLGPLGGPSLALQLVDAQGSPVLLPPPPIPGGESDWAVLAPGASTRFRFAGFVPGWTAPGRYRVRLCYVYQPGSAQSGAWTGELVSAWTDFTVRG